MAVVERRPWGQWEEHIDAPTYRVKRLVVAAGQQFSLQFHVKRSEHWVVVAGSGIATLGNREQRVERGDAIFIPERMRHRLRNAGSEDLVVIETQIGECREDDIVRVDDDYGRL